MSKPKIPGGYYLKARIIKEKTIAHCSPCVREIWDYLLRESTYIKKGSLERGQLFIRYQDVIDDLKWFVGYRKVTYSMDQTKKAMKVLRKHLMIATMKARNGVLVTVLNYDFYNDPKNYEGTNESTNESTNEDPNVPPTINKKVKKVIKKENNIHFDKLFNDYPNTKGSKSQTLKNYETCIKMFSLTDDQIYLACMNSVEKQKEDGSGDYIFQLSNVLGLKYRDDLKNLIEYKASEQNKYHYI